MEIEPGLRSIGRTMSIVLPAPVLAFRIVSWPAKMSRVVASCHSFKMMCRARVKTTRQARFTVEAFSRERLSRNVREGKIFEQI